MNFVELVFIKQMSSSEHTANYNYPRDATGYYYMDNNKKVYFLKDNEGYYYLDKNNNKIYINKTNKSVKELDINVENTNMMNELCSSGYINQNTNPHEIRTATKMQ
jgi:hypothetical protein